MSGHTHCRICDTKLPDPFFNLGAMPLANSFLSSPAEFAGEASYPLAVCACSDCGLVQLNYVVPAEQLYRNYIYVSSTSETVRSHARTLAGNLVRRYGWGSSDLVVEVASNDGTVLKAFQGHGVRVLGVEPAENIAAIAEAEGVPTVAEFFNGETAGVLHTDHREAAGIIGRHVFAHVDNLHDFLEGVRTFLAEDGICIIEVPYLGDLLEHLAFDTIYHEHLSYFSLEPIQRLCERHGLQLIDAERITLHGGSVILHIGRAGQKNKPSERLSRMLAEEQAARFSDARQLIAFVKRVERWKEQFEGLLHELARSGMRLVGYGAAAKANTLLNYCCQTSQVLRVILDRSPHKQELYTPGTHIPVKPVDAWKQERASHLVILAWNFQDEIVRQMRPFTEAGGRFVQVLPRPAILE